MTAVIAWSTSDGKPGAASLYLAADSRITRKNSDGTYKVLCDTFPKVFPSPDTPDIFAICGPVRKLRALITALCDTALSIRRAKSYMEGAEELFPRDLFQTVFFSRDVAPHKGLTILHGYRFRTREFGLSIAKIGDKVSVTGVPLSPIGGLLACDGSGETMVRKVQREYVTKESEAKEFSRWFWMSFYASLNFSPHVTCGGAPQLVGLYSMGAGIPLGTYFKDSSYLQGRITTREDIEYRDALFQRVDRFGYRLPNAQPHARKLAEPSFFNFAQ